MFLNRVAAFCAVGVLFCANQFVHAQGVLPGAGAPGGLAAADIADKVHVVVVADTNADGIGPGVRVNMNLLSEQRVAACLGKGAAPPSNDYSSKLQYHLLTDANVNKANIKAEIKKANVNDTVVAYFCCHGIVDSRGNQSLSISSNETMLRSEVIGWLNSTNARQRVLITDSCAIEDDFADVVAAQQEGVKIPENKIYPLGRLLLKGKGTISINGCLSCFSDTRGNFDLGPHGGGEFSWYSPVNGSIFTRAFARASANLVDGVDLGNDQLTWEKLIDATEKQMNAIFTPKPVTIRINGQKVTRNQLTQRPGVF